MAVEFVHKPQRGYYIITLGLCIYHKATWSLLDCLRPDSVRDPKGHTNMRISHSGSKDQYEGDIKKMACRILMLMWPFGSLLPVRPRHFCELLLGKVTPERLTVHRKPLSLGGLLTGLLLRNVS